MPVNDDKSVDRWQLPRVSAGDAPVIRYHRKTTEKHGKRDGAVSEEAVQAIRENAARQGYQQGQKQALEEYASQLQRLRELIEFFEHPLEALNEDIERQLAQVAISIAQQLVRRELKTDPGEIVGLIRESIKLLPANARNIVLQLHPDDVPLVRDAFSIDSSDDENTWKLVEDPTISRGGCEIKANPSEINLTLEHRLSALAASVLGGEREAD